MKKRVLLGIPTLWVGEWQGIVLADCGFGFKAQFMNEEEDNGKRQVQFVDQKPLN